MRGTRRHRPAGRPDRRIIPAHAGNTVRLDWSLENSADHPRACGEHSPCTGNSGRRTGIIPAHAGNTYSYQYPYSYARDHPRACGEHCPLHVKARSREGSSPRMRGTRSGHAHRNAPQRIIPAHAGNTRPSVSTTARSEDHPRACGEHFLPLSGLKAKRGSSPRMRGTH